MATYKKKEFTHTQEFIVTVAYNSKSKRVYLTGTDIKLAIQEGIDFLDSEEDCRVIVKKA